MHPQNVSFEGENVVLEETSLVVTTPDTFHHPTSQLEVTLLECRLLGDDPHKNFLTNKS